MSTPELRDANPSGRVHVPRRAALLLGLFAALVVYPVMTIVVPWAFSLLGPRYVWTETGPATWNWLGLIFVVAGIAGLIWVFGVMLAQIRHFPEGFGWKTVNGSGRRPDGCCSRAVRSRYSRNPMFLSGLIVWLGWAIFYGESA